MYKCWSEGSLKWSNNKTPASKINNNTYASTPSQEWVEKKLVLIKCERKNHCLHADNFPLSSRMPFRRRCAKNKQRTDAHPISTDWWKNWLRKIKPKHFTEGYILMVFHYIPEQVGQTGAAWKIKSKQN